MINHRIQATAIKNAIEEGERFLLVAHKKPDADTLGSVSAWMSLLKRKGKHVQGFCVDVVPSNLTHLAHSQEIVQDITIFEKDFDIIIVNDAGSLDYAGLDIICDKGLLKDRLLINVDHHATNGHYGDLNLVLSDASSTTEILTRLFMHWNEPIDKAIADALLHGLITDTDKLSNPATSYHSLAIASHLVNSGADIYDTIIKTLHHRPVSDLRIWGIALERLRHNPHYNSVSTFITHKDLAEHESTTDSIEGIVNYLTLIPNVDVILFLRVLEDKTIKGSLRTVKNNIDVSKLAELLGGGGHRKAAGFTIEGGFDIKKNIWTIV